jgi:RNA polymerase sigma factor (sigma-70 family)
MHIYADRYEELFSYSMSLAQGNKGLAEELVSNLATTYFQDEKRLTKEIETLMPLNAQILRLHFFEKQTTKEIAKQLDLKTAQVTVRLQKAIGLIRRQINPDYYKKLIKKAYEHSRALGLR